MAWFRGGVAGAEPPHKGGPNRPDRPNCSGQLSEIAIPLPQNLSRRGDGWCGAESMLEFASILGCTRLGLVQRVQKEQRASTEKVEKSIFIFWKSP